MDKNSKSKFKFSLCCILILLCACTPSQPKLDPNAPESVESKETSFQRKLDPAPSQSDESTKIPLIFSHDGAPDDIAALAYIAKHPEINLLGVINSYGEQHPYESKNEWQRYLYEVIDKDDVAFGLGSAMSLDLAQNQFPASWREGADNFWGVNLPPASRDYESTNGADLIIQLVKNSKDKVTILITGAETDMALALQKDASIKDNIAEVVVMGGAFNRDGNLHEVEGYEDNKVAEWNIYADPLAAKQVFTSGLPVSVVPLDGSDDFYIDRDDLDLISESDYPILAVLYDLWSQQINWWGGKEFKIWDIVAAAAVTNPEHFDWTQDGIDVVAEYGKTHGQTIALNNSSTITRFASSTDFEKVHEAVFEVLLSEEKEESQTKADQIITPDATKTPIKPQKKCSITEEQHKEWETVFCETFDDNSYQWEIGVDSEFGLESSMRSGKYILDFNSANKTGYTTGFMIAHPFWESDEYVVNILGDMDSVYKNCTWGIMVNGLFDTGISFQINNQGNYYLTDYSIPGETYIGNADSGSNSAIKWEKPNSITVVAENEKLRFLVNGTMISAYEYKPAIKKQISYNLWGAEGVSVIYEFDHILVRDKNILSSEEETSVEFQEDEFLCENETSLFCDDFDGDLNASWNWIREKEDQWSLTDKKGYLHLEVEPANPPENILTREAPNGNFEISTHLLFEPSSNFQFAGLMVYQDDNNLLKLGRAYCYFKNVCPGNAIYFDIAVDGKDPDDEPSFRAETQNINEAYIKIRKEGNIYSGYISEDGVEWTFLGKYDANFDPISIGLIAGQTEETIIADFDYFLVEALN